MGVRRFVAIPTLEFLRPPEPPLARLCLSDIWWFGRLFPAWFCLIRLCLSFRTARATTITNISPEATPRMIATMGVIRLSLPFRDGAGLMAAVRKFNKLINNNNNNNNESIDLYLKVEDRTHDQKTLYYKVAK